MLSHRTTSTRSCLKRAFWNLGGGIAAYFEGGKHVAIVYTGIVEILIVLANLVAFYLTIPKTTPRESVGQRPDDGDNVEHIS